MKSVYLVYAIRLDSYFIGKILTKKLGLLTNKQNNVTLNFLSIILILLIPKRRESGGK